MQRVHAMHLTLTNAAEMTCKLLNKHQFCCKDQHVGACTNFASFKRQGDKGIGYKEHVRTNLQEVGDEVAGCPVTMCPGMISEGPGVWGSRRGPIG